MSSIIVSISSILYGPVRQEKIKASTILGYKNDAENTLKKFFLMFRFWDNKEPQNAKLIFGFGSNKIQ